jgi:pimeloyl-ACP methyl ester carboxylesterase
MKRKIFFSSSKNHELCGILSDPTGDKRLPITLLGRTYVRLEEILNANRVSTFRFDFFGHGESSGDFADITINEALDDVRSAIRFVKDSGYERIGLMGSSFGGFASLLAASEADDLFVLALKSPVSDYLGLLIARDNQINIQAWRRLGYISIEGTDGESLRLNYSFFDDAEKIQGYVLAKNIKAPTLIVHGDRDETVPLVQSQKACGIIPRCRLEIIPGADHVYSFPEHFERMICLISDFVIYRGTLESQTNG